MVMKSCEPFFQLKNTLVEALDQFPLFDSNRDSDTFERNGTHGIKVFRQVQFCRAEDVVKKFLVVFSKSAAVLRPTRYLAVDNVRKGWHCPSHY